MTLAEAQHGGPPPRGLVALATADCAHSVVWLRGQHDIATVSVVSETLSRAIALDDGPVVVDLSGVQFMGAATVGVLLRAREYLRRQSRALVLRSPSASAQRVLELCRLPPSLPNG
jgi:anti-anti-sigma factor